MRFLFLTTIYPAPGDSYMTRELAMELVGRGHHVDVLHLAWRAEVGQRTRVRQEGIVTILDVAPRAVTTLGSLVFRISKFLLTSRLAAREVQAFDLGSYDALIAWTPALTVRGPLLKAISAGISKRILFIFDFFPIHHREIGMIPAGPVFAAAKWMEEALMRRFTTIICNLPGNIAYLKARYRLQPAQRVVSTPLWSEIGVPLLASPSDVRARFDLPPDAPIALFGGQIVEGRGIDLILEAATEAERAGSALTFLFMGNGRLAPAIQREAEARANVHYLPGVPREEYLSVVAACDVGLVATVPGVSSFSFPTKTIDYLRAGIPVVAAVEPNNDYLAILENYGVGEGVAFGNAAAFYHAVERQSRERTEAFSKRAHDCLDEIFHVRHTADIVIAAASDVNCGEGRT